MISLIYQENELMLNVKDNGQGYNLNDQMTNPSEGSFGLESMRERIAILEGEIDIYSAPGKGTHIAVTGTNSQNRGRI